jgi:preprotein translocase subunit SecE
MATTGDKGTDEKKTAKPAPRNMALMAAQKRAAAMSDRKPPSLAGAAQWLREARSELKKTTWPTREVLVKSTTVVLTLVLASAVFVGVIDVLLTSVFRVIDGQ